MCAATQEKGTVLRVLIFNLNLMTDEVYSFDLNGILAFLYLASVFELRNHLHDFQLSSRWIRYNEAIQRKYNAHSKANVMSSTVFLEGHSSIFNVGLRDWNVREEKMASLSVIMHIKKNHTM